MANPLDSMLTGEKTEEAMRGSESQPDPVRKEVAGYRPAEDGKACEGCRFFIEPEGCTRVLGQISASGVCDLWEAADTEDMLDSGLDEFLFSGPSGGMQ